MALKRKTAPKSSTSVVPLDGHNEVADNYHRLKERCDELNAELKLLREELITAAKSAWQDALRSGTNAKTVRVAAHGGRSVDVSWSERFYMLDMSSLDDLRGMFGSNLSLYVRETEKIKWQSGISTDAMRNAIGDEAMSKLMTLMTVESGVVPEAAIVAKAAACFMAGDSETGEAILEVLDASQYSPAVKAAK
jgi:hypothetical protein